MSICLDYAEALGGFWDREGNLHWPPIYERHDWGYFLETPDRAVAIVGHGERRLQAGLKELRRHETPRPM